jgi:hypothetical protein
MRVLIGAALAAFLLAAPAVAQTETPALQPSRCASFPAPIAAAPDGASANPQAMTAYDESFRAWAAAADAVITCRNAELEAVRVQYETLRATYTSDAENARALVAGWQAEVNEYNERPPSRRR